MKLVKITSKQLVFNFYCGKKSILEMESCI